MSDLECMRNNQAVYSFAFKRKLIVHFFFSFPCLFVCLIGFYIVFYLCLHETTSLTL